MPFEMTSALTRPCACHVVLETEVGLDDRAEVLGELVCQDAGEEEGITAGCGQVAPTGEEWR